MTGHTKVLNYLQRIYFVTCCRRYLQWGCLSLHSPHFDVSRFLRQDAQGDYSYSTTQWSQSGSKYIKLAQNSSSIYLGIYNTSTYFKYILNYLSTYIQQLAHIAGFSCLQIASLDPRRPVLVGRPTHDIPG